VRLALLDRARQLRMRQCQPRELWNARQQTRRISFNHSHLATTLEETTPLARVSAVVSTDKRDDWKTDAWRACDFSASNV
jgi:hypothetical protein